MDGAPAIPHPVRTEIVAKPGPVLPKPRPSCRADDTSYARHELGAPRRKDARLRTRSGKSRLPFLLGFLCKCLWVAPVCEVKLCKCCRVQVLFGSRSAFVHCFCFFTTAYVCFFGFIVFLCIAFGVLYYCIIHAFRAAVWCGINVLVQLFPLCFVSFF